MPDVHDGTTYRDVVIELQRAWNEHGRALLAKSWRPGNWYVVQLLFEGTEHCAIDAPPLAGAYVAVFHCRIHDSGCCCLT